MEKVNYITCKYCARIFYNNDDLETEYVGSSSFNDILRLSSITIDIETLINEKKFQVKSTIKL